MDTITLSGLMPKYQQPNGCLPLCIAFHKQGLSVFQLAQAGSE
jgi:hypothetical protein